MKDWRNIVHGREIPTEHYSDQPYIVETDDGAWLCVVTTGSGMEGQHGQHVVTLRSTDHGHTWSDPVDVEPGDGPEASYAVLLKVPSERIFCFYNHNTDNVREVIADVPGGTWTRVDSLGHFVFKYSDDHGQSWSDQRYDIPMRTMAIDRQNPYGGELKFFWNVGKPFILEGAAYVPLYKIGGFGEGAFTSSEGVLLRSDNLLTEEDPEAVTWETLPEGEIGLRTPPGGGPVAEEHSYVVLSDGTIYTIYRTIDGHPVYAYSRDGGCTWSTPAYLRYADGRLVKHPRAANFVWRCQNGKYLYWYHNHGGHFVPEHPQWGSYAYEHRNPVWMCGGVEVDTSEGKLLQWSQPEIVLYDDDPYIRISYPDLIEADDRYFLTETQKDVARVHQLPAEIPEGLWSQFEAPSSVVEQGLLIEVEAEDGAMPSEVDMPRLPRFLDRDTTRFDHGTLDHRGGITVELWMTLNNLAPNQTILDNRTPDGRGFALHLREGGVLELTLRDAQTDSRWASDAGMVEVGLRHHVAVLVDGGPKVITFVIDGKVHDGGEQRQVGWGRYSPNLRDVNGAPQLNIGRDLASQIHLLRLYSRALRVSEVVAHAKLE